MRRACCDASRAVAFHAVGNPAPARHTFLSIT
jgi:hypothetical protein